MNESSRRLRIYLDTTVPNGLFVTGFRLPHTVKFWERCRDGKYDIFVSPVFFRELDDCPQPKLDQISKQLDLIKFVILNETDEVKELALQYINNGVLGQDCYNDCLHIAQAVVNNCDLLVSWNFNHLVKYETMEGVKLVNAINRYK